MNMVFIGLVLFGSVCVLCGTVLVITGHPWWAGVPFLMAATASYKSKEGG